VERKIRKINSDLLVLRAASLSKTPMVGAVLNPHYLCLIIILIITTTNQIAITNITKASAQYSKRYNIIPITSAYCKKRGALSERQQEHGFWKGGNQQKPHKACWMKKEADKTLWVEARWRASTAYYVIKVDQSALA
jgi:hypothetical protein